MFKKLFERKTSDDESSIFLALTNQGFVYAVRDLYLGKQAELISPDGNILLKWSFTERDGLCLQLKRKEPYAVLFEYSDGGYLINDDRDEVRKLLAVSKSQLDKLRNELIYDDHENAFSRLEDVMMATLVKPGDHLRLFL